MGSIKSNQYTKEETNLFLATRAFAHPARIRMVKLFQLKMELRNTDLCKELNLSKASVKNHLQMLKDANLITIEYFAHCYKVSLNQKGVDTTKKILNLD